VVFLKVLLFLIFIAMSESSSAYRCNSRLVHEGDFQSKVLEKCGEPDSIRSRYERRVPAGQGNIGFPGERNVGDWAEGQLPKPQQTQSGLNYGYEKIVLIEVWIYDFGKARGLKAIKFEDGALTGFGRLDEIE
jgi:Protein of unknown function (DUF2845)